MKILVTGCAGFIGFHLCLNFFKKKNYQVFGIDNLNEYYDIDLKKNRLKILKKNKNFSFYKINFCDYEKLITNFNKNNYDCVVHLGAQAGVRYSIMNPSTYLKNNVDGFFNILETSRLTKIKHLLFASSSSVYGNSVNFPLSENEFTDTPMSFYAASKKSNEILAHSYSNIYKLPITGLRFFTVYGPFGRPDMSLFLFTKAILNNKKIFLFNSGNHTRDFTYVDDVAKSIEKLIRKKPKTKIPFDIYNIGSDSPIHLKSFLSILEKFLGKKAKIINKPMQKGDVIKTHANVDKLKKRVGFKPITSIESGIKSFVEWYLEYYNLK